MYDYYKVERGNVRFEVSPEWVFRRGREVIRRGWTHLRVLEQRGLAVFLIALLVGIRGVQLDHVLGVGDGGLHCMSSMAGGADRGL